MIEYIRESVPPGSVIFGDWGTSALLPAFAPVYTYAGHQLQTPDFFTKEYLTKQFYMNQMTESQALRLMKDNGVNYVFHGDGERGFASKLKYSFLIPVIHFGNYTLYQI